MEGRVKKTPATSEHFENALMHLLHRQWREVSLRDETLAVPYHTRQICQHLSHKVVHTWDARQA